MKILIAMNEFKGCLTSKELADTIEAAINDENCKMQIKKEIIADGGDGFLEMFQDFYKKTFRTVGANNKPINAKYLVNYKEKTAVIEVAEVIGIKYLKSYERNPYVTTTCGLGMLINFLLNKGINNFIIGLGGSATNDCGIGMLSELGFRFYSLSDEVCKHGIGDLKKIIKIDDTKVNPRLKNAKFNLICDVTNRLCGKYGATHVFGKQKGLKVEELNVVDNYIKEFSKLVSKKYNISKYRLNGSGAAGGLAFGFLSFMNSRIYKGSQFMIDYLNMDNKIQNCDILVTGEGKLDIQSFMGKAPIEIARIAKKYNKKVIFLAGMIDDEKLESLSENDKNIIDASFSIQRGVYPMAQAVNKIKAKINISNTTKQIVRLLSFNEK